MSAPTSEVPPAGTGTPAASVIHPLALLQPWIDFVPQKQRRLGLFIFLALLLHLAAFCFIRLDPNRPGLEHETLTHATVENTGPAAEADSGDAFWDRLTDPRLFLLPILPLTRFTHDEPPLDFSAINSGIGPTQLPPSAPPENYSLTRLASPGPEEQVQAHLWPMRQPFAYRETPPVPVTKTGWQVGPSLVARRPLSLPPLPSPVSAADLNPTELRVAIDGDGAVQYVLLEETCQQPDLDRQAILAARKIQFAPADRPGLTWGKLTVFWHNTAPPPEVVVPTPPST
jgi:hypothetical protein